MDGAFNPASNWDAPGAGVSNCLQTSPKTLPSTPMKLALAVLVYVLIGVVLGAGILLTVAGKPWFLIAAVIAYVVAFGKIGCMTH
ncbi:MAG: hypothetical protein ABSC24_05505 [Verrucomicrobiota bacterium]